uniref:Integral to membrane n=1 Tax=Rhipicephalus appendiculatus TaxID=34631 RepID=A0A131YCL2_RHIAP
MSNRRVITNSCGAGDCEYVLLQDATMKMEPYDHDLNVNQDLRGFTLGYGVAQLFGLGCVLMVVVWTSHYFGGFSGPSNPKTEFNYHPVFMVLGMVFLYGNVLCILTR